MTKNIEALAKIGEQVVFNKLNDSLNKLTRELVYREQDLRHEWETGFKIKAKLYAQIRNEAIGFGLDISNYEEEFSRLNKKYLELIKKETIVVEKQ
jgi:hypothetical protein